jgi:hypothetical protein
VTDRLVLSVTTQVPVPLQPAPDQPLKVEPPLGVAVSATVSPFGNFAEQIPGQEMPVPKTLPEPLPARETVSRRWGFETTVTSRVVE